MLYLWFHGIGNVLGTANFNAHHGCQKCTTIGSFNELSRTTVFKTGVECPKRTDECFRKGEYGHHHKRNTPLTQLDVDMIKQFPVGDSLHLLHLGVMKRLLFAWRDGIFRKTRTKLSAAHIEDISKFLTTKCKFPREIHRRMRGLDCLSHWKGLECRSFILYVGIVVLKDPILPYTGYQHFLTLFCAVTICESPKHAHLLPIAREMLKHYVDCFKTIYGAQYVTSNVHNLLHLIDDVEFLGELQSFTAYPFENTLGNIKRLIRGRRYTLRQVANRMSEITAAADPIDLNLENASSSRPFVLTKRNAGHNVPSKFKRTSSDKTFFHSMIDNGDMSISTDSANQWFLTNDNEIVSLQNIISSNDGKEILLYGIEVQDKRDFFDLPIPSSTLNIYTSDYFVDENIEGNLFDPSNIKCKLVHLQFSEVTKIFIPLLHTYQNNSV